MTLFGVREILVEHPSLLPGKPPRDERCIAWYLDKWGLWTGGGWREGRTWTRCWNRAKRYRAYQDSVVAVCGVHARVLRINVTNPKIEGGE